MPWHVQQGGGTCAAGDYAVIKDSDGSTAGCHPTKAKAEAQMAALYANEPMMHAATPGGDLAVVGDFSTYLARRNEGGAEDVPARPEFPTVGERSFPFEVVRADTNGDGLTFEGYAAVFNTPTRITGWEGEFEEVIKPGAFTRTLSERTPKLMFEHGRHPLIGQMPLGVINEAREDRRGLFIRARLTDNWLIQPVRDAVRDGAVDGMSFRFSVPEGGDKVTRRKDRLPLRELLDIDAPELGPVVFPAYEPTTAAVRSLVERLEDFTGRPDARSAGGGDPDAPSGNGEASPTPDDLARDRAWQLRRRLR